MNFLEQVKRTSRYKYKLGINRRLQAFASLPDEPPSPSQSMKILMNLKAYRDETTPELIETYVMLMLPSPSVCLEYILTTHTIWPGMVESILSSPATKTEYIEYLKDSLTSLYATTKGN